jgi:hypothetical protein
MMSRRNRPRAMIDGKRASKFADQCASAADAASSHHGRDRLLAEARTWRLLAAQAEAWDLLGRALAQDA